MIEIVFAMSILTVGFLAQSSLTVTQHKQHRLNLEHRVALKAIRDQVTLLRGVAFESVFASFDKNPSNDPTFAPGPHFDVDELEPDPADVDGRVGRVIFPTLKPTSTAAPVLREDYADASMGMPADLDGDGLIDAQAKDENYIHLPVVIELRWRGVLGPQTSRIATWLTPRGNP